MIFFLLQGRAVTAVFMFVQHVYNCIAVTRKLGGLVLFWFSFLFIKGKRMALTSPGNTRALLHSCWPCITASFS